MHPVLSLKPIGTFSSVGYQRDGELIQNAFDYELSFRTSAAVIE